MTGFSSERLKVLDLVTFEGTTVEELEKAFQSMVDAHLNDPAIQHELETGE